MATSKEALTRSERERAAMDKKIQTLTKRVAEATQQPAFLQRALDESSKEACLSAFLALGFPFFVFIDRKSERCH